MKTAKYFKNSEFEKCSPPCSIEDMDQDFLNLLDDIREAMGVPLVLNSAYRSPEWDRSKGRSGNGGHTKRCAVDIRCNDSATRARLVRVAGDFGITRIGIANTFVHIDTAKDLPSPSIWLY